MADLKPADFPPEVHASLSELQQIAAQAKSKDDPRLRYATPMEIALSELLRHPSHCSGHSKRTGLACRGAAVTGMTVCMKHGGQYKAAKDAAKRRLQQVTGPVLREMHKLAMDTNPKKAMVKFKAAQDLLDRAGIGDLVEAKVRHSYHGQLSSGVTVQIGFLTPPAPPALEGGQARLTAQEAAHAEDPPVIEGTVNEDPAAIDRAAEAAAARPAGGPGAS